jgi:Tfp pilus assembly protein FimV
MSTTPAVPIATQLHPISAYLKAHERLVLAGIAAVLLWFAVGHVESIIAKHDDANLLQAKITAQSQAEKTEALAAQATAQAEQYKELAAKVQQQNSALVTANTQLATALAQQQHTDSTLPPSELANRWSTLVPQAKPTVTATGIAVDTPSAIATVQALEQVPVLSAQLGNERTQLESTQKLLGLSQNETVTLGNEVSSLNLQLKDNQTVCNQQIAVVKAEARRSKRRWFVIGYVAGFLSRQYIKTATGL